MELTSRLVIIVAFGLAGCAQYATVSEHRPRFEPATPLGKTIAKAFANDRRDPLRAIGEYLTAVEVASQELKSDPSNSAARDDYNFALSRVFTTLRSAKPDPWTQPMLVHGTAGVYRLTHRPLKQKAAHPALYEFTPADEFDIKGTYVSERTVKPGIGAPLVAVGKDKRENATIEHAPTRTFYGVTAVARFDSKPGSNGARRVTIAFEDPLAVETISLNGRTFPLAADFTVPLAVMLARENPKKLEIARVLQPEKYAETAHVTRLQPYDRTRPSSSSSMA
jgi:hypothetical protein